MRVRRCDHGSDLDCMVVFIGEVCPLCDLSEQVSELEDQLIAAENDVHTLRTQAPE